MRLDRNTLILIVVLLAVVAGALFVTNQQASVPATTATPNPASGILFAEVANSGVIARIEVREAVTSSFVELTRRDVQTWAISGTGALADRDANSTQIETTATQLSTVEYTSSFESEALADFGLTAPQYAVVVETGAGAAYTLYIGARTPTNPRYYAVLETGALPLDDGEATPEVTLEFDPFAGLQPPTVAGRPALPALSGTKTIYVIPQTVITTLTGWLTAPPYLPPPTATLPPTLTPIPEVTAETTAEATAEATVEVTAETTAEATAEATAAP